MCAMIYSGPDYGGSGDTSDPPPPEDIVLPWSTNDEEDNYDVFAQFQMIDPDLPRVPCAMSMFLTTGQATWCNSPPAQDAAAIHIDAALNNMRQIGGVCTQLADYGLQLLHGKDGPIIHILDDTQAGTVGEHGLAPLGNRPYEWLLVGKTFTDQYYDAAHKIRVGNPNFPTVTQDVDLQFILAHELEHLLFGAVHIGERSGDPAAVDPVNTPNSRLCGGLG